jgi:hypothetical protein
LEFSQELAMGKDRGEMLDLELLDIAENLGAMAKENLAKTGSFWGGYRFR